MRPSAETMSGISERLAGTKKSATVDAKNASRYAQPMPKPATNGIARTAAARRRSAVSMVRLRSHRSTYTPATTPKSAAGSSVTPNMMPICSIEPVIAYTMIAIAI